MSSLVSIIIPFYSNFEWLTEAVESVLNQTYTDYEIIVINDGSLENDSAFLAEYRGRISYIKTPNQGPAKARNIGIQNARGDYIAFLDSDDLWMPNKLKEQVSYMDSNDLVWSHTSYVLFDNDTGSDIKALHVGEFHGEVFTRCLISSPIATPCIMVRRDFLYKHPEVRFSEKMRYGQDGFMWLNIASYAQLGAINIPLSRVRMRGGNAALRARVYLKVKAQISDFIENKVEMSVSRYQNIPIRLRIIYAICKRFDAVLTNWESKLHLKKDTTELLARILYLPVYLSLKINKVITKNS